MLTHLDLFREKRTPARPGLLLPLYARILEQKKGPTVGSVYGQSYARVGLPVAWLVFHHVCFNIRIALHDDFTGGRNVT